MTMYKTGGIADAGVAIIVGLLIGLIAAALVPTTNAQPQSGGAGASGSFSHANCQYPDRWSNPVDGCDNSDPAVPECIKSFSTKAAEDACIAAFVAEHEQAAPIETVTPAPAEKPAECSGK